MNEIESLVAKIKNNESVTRDELRTVARHYSVKQGKTRAELEDNVKNHIKTLAPIRNTAINVVRPVGRPKAKPEDLVGYKVRVGLRYVKNDGTMASNMKEGTTFANKNDGQKVLDGLVMAGEVRVWAGKVRAHFLPRYN